MENTSLKKIRNNNEIRKDNFGEGLSPEKEDYFDLDELGVLEADDDIFENFDEENIPVIKNIYKRKKSSAEKFKTNQSNRNNFLNNQNHQIHNQQNMNQYQQNSNQQHHIHFQNHNNNLNNQYMITQKDEKNNNNKFIHNQNQNNNNNYNHQYNNQLKKKEGKFLLSYFLILILKLF
jgi:hypothetical protein